MSDTTTVSGAAAGESGATPEEIQQNQTEPQLRTGDRALDDTIKYKKQLQDAQAENARLKAEAEAVRVAKLKSDERWKELALEQEKVAQSAKDEYNKLLNSMKTNKVSSEIKMHATRAGLKPGYESVIDMMPAEGVTADWTERGDILVHGVKEHIEKVRLQMPDLFQKAPPQGINSGGTSQPAIGGTITAEELVALQFKDPVKYKEMAKRFMEQRTKR